jgi:hypothetical protein
LSRAIGRRGYCRGNCYSNRIRYPFPPAAAPGSEYRYVTDVAVPVVGSVLKSTNMGSTNRLISPPGGHDVKAALINGIGVLIDLEQPVRDRARSRTSVSKNTEMLLLSAIRLPLNP